jgi:OmcA/MtrC family decaheme c-type cytochrome
MDMQQLRLWFGAAVLSVLTACGGGGGSDRAEGVAPGPESPGGSVTAPPPPLPTPAAGYAEADEIIAWITGASVDAGNFVVDFQVTDGNGNAIIDLQQSNIRLVFGKLQASPLGNLTGDWQSYVNRIEQPNPDVGTGTEPKLQAFYERDGEFTNNQDGTYRYRSIIDVNNLPADMLAQAETEGLDLSYEPDRTHRVAMQFDGGPNAQNPWYDWVPATGATEGIFHQDISATVNCNRCHDPLAIHGGNRQAVEYCVVCHNTGSTDANSGNSVAMKDMIHKIHMGANLPSVQAGGEYAIYGFRNSKHDYSGLLYPQDIRNCQNCHVGTGTTNDFYTRAALTNQGDNWNEFPTRQACGSCHDDVDFDQHFGGQPDDTNCGSCHSSTGGVGTVASSHVMAIRDEGARYVAKVESVENSGPGDFPSVDIRVTNPETGTDYDLLNDAPFTNDGASLNVKLGWATTDYTNEGNGADNASTLSQSALSTGTPNGDGSFNVVFQTAIPGGGAASGSGVAIIDGHPTVDMDGDGDPDNIWVKDAHKFFSIDEADGVAKPRREIVEIENCLDCHQNLVLHGSNRADNIDSCVACHNPRGTDRSVRDIANNPPTDGKQEESVHFTTMIHAIHAAGIRENPIQIVGFRGFNTHVYDEEHVHYPGDLSNCTACHGNSGYELPLASTVLGTTIDTGNDRENPHDDLVITPASAACSSCHDSATARAHMEGEGGNFSTTQSAIDNGEVVETCDVCHAEGRSHDVAELHGLD